MPLILLALAACHHPMGDCYGAQDALPAGVFFYTVAEAHPAIVAPYVAAGDWATEGGDLASRCSDRIFPEAVVESQWAAYPVSTPNGSFIVGNVWLSNVPTDGNDSYRVDCLPTGDNPWMGFEVAFRPGLESVSIDPADYALILEPVCNRGFALTLEGMDRIFFERGGILLVEAPGVDEVGFALHRYSSWPQTLEAGDLVIITAVDALGGRISAEMTFPEVPEE